MKMINNRNDNVNTRNLVVDILLAVTRDGEFSHIAIRDVLDKYRYLPKHSVPPSCEGRIFP